jgi:hypothetical protein
MQIWPITLFNIQYVMEARLAKRYYFEAAEFENGIRSFQISFNFRVAYMAWKLTFFSTTY